MMKLCLTGALIIVGIYLSSPLALALGTSAGTNITNQATANYTVGASSYTVTSAQAIATVAEVIDVTITWQDVADVTVNSGGTSEVLTFLVSNTGNGNESFSLTVDNLLGTPDFDPALAGIYEDTNGNASYDSGTDPSVINTSVLAEDTSTTVFVVNNIPGGRSNGDRGESQLTATSRTPASGGIPWIPGFIEPNAGDGGTDAVVGTSGGSAGTSGFYIVSSVSIALVKSATILNSFGTTEPVSGAEITYVIDVTAPGSGTATNVVITDLIPADTTYSPGTLELDGVSLTDQGGDDDGDVNATTAGTVTVALNSVAAGSPAQQITFKVTINY